MNAGGEDSQIGDDINMPSNEEEFKAYVKETEGRDPTQEEIDEYMKMVEQGGLQGNSDQELAQDMP